MENNNVEITNDDLAFKQAMDRKIQESFSPTSANASEQAAAQKLREMNKKLPSWNLEPPYTFLK